MRSFDQSNLENIKTIFEQKTGIELEPAPNRSHRSLQKMLLAIAVLTCFFALTCYALAAKFGINDLFKDYFRSRQEVPLSEGQHHYIDDRAASIGESVMQDGITVTVTGAISDGTVSYIWLDISAPADQSIETLPLGFDVEFEKLRLSGQENDSISGISISCVPVPDNDGMAHTASMLIEYSVYQPRGSRFTFADGRQRTLRLKNLFYHESEYPYSLRTVAEGVWEFSFSFAVADNHCVELLNEPVLSSYCQISGKQVDAAITSIELKALSAVVYYTIDANEVQEAGDFGILKLEMKDGTVIRGYPQKAGQTVWMSAGNLIPGTDCHYCAYVFEAPVRHEEIQSLYIGEQVIEIKIQ